jgi:magnesium transporter
MGHGKRRAIMVHVLFGPEVRLLLEENDIAGMKAFCEHLHPATVAEALAGELDVDAVWRFLGHTSIRNQAAIFEYFPIEWQVKMVEGTGRQHMARLIEQMSHDDRVDLLRRLMPRVAEGLLRLVDEADRRDIATLVSYPVNTAGAMMTTDYAWLPANITGTEALDRLRLQAPDRETIYYVYVLDDQRKLLGVLSLRDLILAPRQALVRDIMDKEAVTVRADDDREQVAQVMARYDLLAIPVTDAEGRLVGIVTHDDVMDVVVQEATEDAYRMGAVGPMAENYLEANFATVWRKRAMWLACLFVAELFTFTAMAYFEDSIARLVVLSLFIPLCLSTGGNSGLQAATLITRAIALGQVTLGNWKRVIRHELFMGIALGLTLGAIGYLRGAVTPEKTRSDTRRMEDAFVVRLPAAMELQRTSEGTFALPTGAVQVTQSTMERPSHITLPEGQSMRPVGERNGQQEYEFPAGTEVHYEAVSRWSLAIVVSLAVFCICLWGTLIGSMLPLVFKRIGVDPGIASSPFVATFVDVTGIVIYFSIARVYLLPG